MLVGYDIVDSVVLYCALLCLSIHVCCEFIPLQCFSHFQMSLLSRIRLTKYFPDFTRRVQCVQSRLQAIAVLGNESSLQT